MLNSIIIKINLMCSIIFQCFKLTFWFHLSSQCPACFNPNIEGQIGVFFYLEVSKCLWVDDYIQSTHERQTPHRQMRTTEADNICTTQVCAVTRNDVTRSHSSWAMRCRMGNENMNERKDDRWTTREKKGKFIHLGNSARYHNPGHGSRCWLCPRLGKRHCEASSHSRFGTVDNE